MTFHFTKYSEKENRKWLRENCTRNEELVWMYIRRKQILGERFIRQYSVDKYVIDFYCPRLKLAIEIDGPTHYKDGEIIEYDKIRQKYLESFGITFIRFQDKQITDNADEVFDKLIDKVREMQSKKSLLHPPLPRGGI